MKTQVYIDDWTTDQLPATDGSARLVPAACQATGRVEYRRVRRGCPARVIADFLPDGHEHFGDQEFNEVMWHHYVPSAQERAFALHLLQAQQDADH